MSFFDNAQCSKTHTHTIMHYILNRQNASVSQSCHFNLFFGRVFDSAKLKMCIFKDIKDTIKQKLWQQQQPPLGKNAYCITFPICHKL